VDNIKMDLIEIGLGYMEWRACVNKVMNLWFHKMLGSS
jgi:hypothetical protein